MLTDTHSHLYSSKFLADRQDMLQRAFKAGVERIFLPAIDSETHEDLLKLADANPQKCFPMMGIHPCSVNEETAAKEFELVLDYFSKREFVAVGEIGIDLYWDKTTLSIQQEYFAKQIDLALEKDLPIVIHSRSAFNECYEIVKAKQNGKLTGVFHCFSDGITEAEKVISLGGFMLGIGGVLTFRNSGLDKVVEHVGMEHLVLETDSPYLAPVPFRGKRNESAFLVHIAQKMADIKQLRVEEVAEITTENSKKLFRV